MVSLESQVHVQPHSSRSMDPPPPPPSSSSPRISFSSDFLDDNDYISISPHSHRVHSDLEQALNLDFEFLSNTNNANSITNNATADQLFFEGKLLPFWQVQHHSDKLGKIKIKEEEEDEEQQGVVVIAAAATTKDHQEMKSLDMGRVNTWFVDEDPSPRPPKCTVLWKELLRLKKQRNVSSLSPSSSTSSSSSSMSVEEDKNNKNKDKEGGGLWNKEKHVRRIKKGLERTRSTASMIRIRPMVNVPICTHTSSSLPPLFPLNTNNRFFHTSRD